MRAEERRADRHEMLVRQLGYRFGTNLVKQVIKRGRVYSVDVGYYRTA